MEVKRKRIFYCFIGDSVFNNTDYEILSTSFDVYKFKYKPKINLLGKVLTILESFIKAVYYVPKCDVVYSFFVAYHCFFPVIIGKLLGKKIVLTIGGFDAMAIPSLNYGIFNSRGLLPFVAKIIYRLADTILPVNTSLISSTNFYADPSGKGYVTGFKNHVSGIKADIHELATGYDQNRYYRDNTIMRKKSVLAFASVNNFQNFRRKGYDLILEAAELMPEIHFSLVGVKKEIITDYKTKLMNVDFVDFVDHSEAIKFFSSHTVFLQLSIAEGLPNALCEAMMCECIPVGTNVNGIPNAIGDTGFILYNRDANDLKLLIMKALTMDESQGKKARQRIIDMFPFEKRKEKLISYIMPQI